MCEVKYCHLESEEAEKESGAGAWLVEEGDCKEEEEEEMEEEENFLALCRSEAERSVRGVLPRSNGRTRPCRPVAPRRDWNPGHLRNAKLRKGR